MISAVTLLLKGERINPGIDRREAMWFKKNCLYQILYEYV